MNTAQLIRISLITLAVTHAAVGQATVPPSASGLTAAQWQEIASRVVLQYCKAPVTSTTTLDDFEANLPACYRMPADGVKPNSAQTAVNQQATMLLLAAQGGIQPAEYGLVFGTSAPVANAPAPAQTPANVTIDTNGLAKVNKGLSKAACELAQEPPLSAAASTDVQQATKDLAIAVKMLPKSDVSHFFVSAAYQVANPYVF